MSRTRFYTGLVTLLEDERRGGPWKGRGWIARLGRKRDELRIMNDPDAREIVIEAARRGTAHKALDLILTLHAIGSGDPLDLHDLEVVGENEPTTDEDTPARRLGPLGVCAAGFPQACKMAAKASQRHKWVYAAALYRLSQTLHANVTMDLEPRMYRSDFPYDHLRYAYAIVTGYAILEQLGFEVRSSSKKPAMRNRRWNPPVLADLLHRLKQAHVDEDETIMWMIRGGKTRLERTRPPRSIAKQSWAYGQVRDCEVKLVDAINDLRWLRNRVSAHRVDRLVGLLSIYDVANAQNLSRRLILGSLGFPS